MLQLAYAVHTPAAAGPAAIYHSLRNGPPDAAALEQARAFLAHRLQAARQLRAELPATPDQLGGWSASHAFTIGMEYQAYLRGRRDGAPRRYFSNQSHALYFLRHVAPTKLVDGAWLYGLLAHWDDADFRPLIQTYLEELGDGVPEKNHVLLYKKLLAAHACEDWQQLPDTYFEQGAIQLALAYDAERYLPEIIGYNLGYEQLPLHLLVTAYELNELGIDPYYFTLHITVDNGSTGHAHKAVQALQQLLPRFGDSATVWQRMLDGYRLNDLGACTTSVIGEFDLHAELVGIMAAKSHTGCNMHSDYCRLAGRSINQWLADPQQIPAMLSELENAGWIQRGQAPEHSRFWRLIQSERAEMFGVFSAYEQQVLRDWIATPATPARVPSFRARQRSLDALGMHHTPRQGVPRGIVRHHADDDDASPLRRLEQQIATLGSKQAAMQLLQALMTPAVHHTPLGLMARRIYRQLID
ncbi:iron-containing redox enzyme family protein [Duganella radicis]|uniref:Iron-containing redox enzyme family protein n=1 Tax=Duganella radicis TaxID=551988 RepID=A0A6L6PR86_9BURK|nr:iron-containing redox enzyme family protein [Duganella radicis]MTV41628.1 iron-containing redox enzyme family protein [Duganella radicis]